MSDDAFDSEGGNEIAQDRRAFVKRMLAGAAFAVPTIVSFNMAGMSAAAGAAFSSNKTEAQYWGERWGRSNNENVNDNGRDITGAKVESFVEEGNMGAKPPEGGWHLGRDPE